MKSTARRPQRVPPGTPLVPGRGALTVRGADNSSLKKSEDKGGIYAYEDGTQADALTILRDHGMNNAHIRVWANSPDGYHGKAQVLACKPPF